MYYYVVNPAAGGSRLDKIQDRLKSRLKNLGILGEFVKSTGPEDVAKLARMGIEKGYKTIVAVGGDGTINEVLNEIIDNQRVSLGVIPIGTTNDLARSLGIKDWLTATKFLSSRKVEKINLGKVNDRYFITSVSCGFDAEFSSKKRLITGNIFEKASFAAKVFKEATSFKTIPAKLIFDGNYEVEAKIFSAIVSNPSFSSFRDTTSKKDNLLDTVVITKIPGYKMLKYAYNPNSANIDLPKISVFHSREIEIITKKPVEVSADGQVIGTTPVKVAAASKKVNIIVPRKR